MFSAILSFIWHAIVGALDVVAGEVLTSLVYVAFILVLCSIFWLGQGILWLGRKALLLAGVTFTDTNVTEEIVYKFEETE